jgi:hypothetical protein
VCGPLSVLGDWLFQFRVANEATEHDNSIAYNRGFATSFIIDETAKFICLLCWNGIRRKCGYRNHYVKFGICIIHYYLKKCNWKNISTQINIFPLNSDHFNRYCECVILFTISYHHCVQSVNQKSFNSKCLDWIPGGPTIVKKILSLSRQGNIS